MSYVPKKNRCLIVMSTTHHGNKIDAATGEEIMLDIITLYNDVQGIYRSDICHL